MTGFVRVNLYNTLVAAKHNNILKERIQVETIKNFRIP